MKYKHVENYARMFSTSMKNKWPQRAYIDLFAGAGRAKLKESGDIVEASPLIALGVRDSFDNYIFCEEDPKRMEALKERVSKYSNADRVSYVAGDINHKIHSLLSRIPNAKETLAFCFADPFSLENLKFSTIQALSRLHIDFLILIPSFMDANRNPKYYLPPSNHIVEDFLGEPDWRAHWSRARLTASKFGVFILERYKKRMKALGFLYEELPQLEIRTGNNIPLYHLAFFSTNPLALKFWKETRKSSDHQRRLF